MDPAQAFRHTISRFAFSPPSTPTPEPCTRSAVLMKDEPKEEISSPDFEDQRVRPVIRSSKRASVTGELDEGSPKKKRLVKKRGYADPETYAHLDLLTDRIAPSLDVLFCGINPGCMSATKGHHFANPTNHFWKALHLSGFTPRLLSPSEDVTLPIIYSLGLTNLVSRPSAEQAELSKDEMTASVPSLKTKIAKCRPRIVCFVGKGIWVIVEAVFKKQVRDTGQDSSRKDTAVNDDTYADTCDAGDGPLSPSSTPRNASTKRIRNGLKSVSKAFDWGLQPYKLVYTDFKSASIKEAQTERNGPSVDGSELSTRGSCATETLFFVTPSTSGRVASHQLTDKVKLFTRLRDDLERIKCNAMDTSGMEIVPLP